MGCAFRVHAGSGPSRFHAEGLPNDQGELKSRMERFMSKLRSLPKHTRNDFRNPFANYAAAGM